MMYQLSITHDGYLELTYPISDHEEGSEFYTLVSERPTDLARETRVLTMHPSGQKYQTGIVAVENERHGRHGRGVAWPIEGE